MCLGDWVISLSIVGIIFVILYIGGQAYEWLEEKVLKPKS